MTDRETPEGDDEEGTVDSSASTVNQGSADLVLEPMDDDADEVSRMSMAELMEAAEDESHPRHEEALQRSKELAEALKPSLQSLQRQVSAQMGKAFEGIKLPTAKALGLGGLGESVFESLRSVIPTTSLVSSVDWSASLPPSAALLPMPDPVHRPDFEELAEGIAEAAREREERAERQVELAATQVETLEAVAAQLHQLNRRMESVDQRLDQSHRSSGTAFGWTITVGALTLVATIVGIIVAVWLSQG